MKLLSFFLILTSTSGLLYAEEEAAPPRRRPRIRVYDQEAQLVPVARPVEADLEAEAALEKRIRGGMSAPSSLEMPVRGISLIPSYEPTAADARAEEEEEEEWITPMDFLLEEEKTAEEDLLLSVEEEEVQNEEMEITDWEKLQKSMIEEALQKKEPELSDEEMEELLASREEEEQNFQSSGGLEVEEVAPVQDLNQAGAELGGRYLPDARGESPGFVPVLSSSRQMNGDINRPEPNVSTSAGLPGSQGMLNDLKEKWARKPEAAPVNPTPREFTAGALPRESLMSRPRVGTGGFQGLGLGNPAVSPLPQRLPAARAPEPRRVEPPAPAPRTEPGSLRRDDYRIRSRLNNPSGL